MALDLTKLPIFRCEDNGPFTDDFVRRMIAVQATQYGVIKYMEAMAQVMAEAAIASQKATGDHPSYAVAKWADVVKKRALELLREKAESKNKIAKGTIIEGE